MVRAGVGSSPSAWRERLQRYSRSGLTVTEFCSKEKVSVPSFYAWKKKLNVDASNGVWNRGETRDLAFQAVSLVGRPPVMSARLPGGVQLEVGVVNLEVVRAVVGELVRADHAAATGEASC